MDNSQEKIIKAITWYKEKNKWMASDLYNLINVARLLACEIFFYAMEVGNAHEQMTAAEYTRKSQFAHVCQKLSAAEEKSGNKVIQSQIEKAATIQVDNFALEEAKTESIYRKMFLLLDTAKNVHDQMRQQISYFKTEKVQEMNGTGSQQ